MSGAEIKWYAFAAVGGFGSIIWPYVYDGQSDIQLAACTLFMFFAWGIGDVLRAVRKSGEDK